MASHVEPQISDALVYNKKLSIAIQRLGDEIHTQNRMAMDGIK
jgi:hypothetical protein